MVTHELLCGHLWRTRRRSTVAIIRRRSTTLAHRTITTTTSTATRKCSVSIGTGRQFSSVSSSEVGKFSALSKTWWDPTQNPLIGMNGIRMQYIQQQVWQQQRDPTAKEEQPTHPPLTGFKVLDVGCGGGLLSESLARLGAQVTAIDPSTELVDAARFHSQLDPRTRHIDFRGGTSVEELAVAAADTSSHQYDIICLLEVLEHVTDPNSMLSSIHSLLKPNGLFFLSTLNRTVKSKVVAIWGAEYIMKYLPVGTHDWTQFRSPGDVHKLMKSNGFQEAHVTGMVLNSPPVWGNWDWRLGESDVDINWIGTYQKRNEV
jgi:2-polyprenyl-6-hydroxyphenyl methylase / 3-demethylubiquinone-9 3-methyltransferase